MAGGEGGKVGWRYGTPWYARCARFRVALVDAKILIGRVHSWFLKVHDEAKTLGSRGILRLLGSSVSSVLVYSYVSDAVAPRKICTLLSYSRRFATLGALR